MTGLRFNVGLQKDLLFLNNEVAEHGGCAFSGQDDVFVLGPSPHIFSAVDSLQERIRLRCGLELQRDKTEVEFVQAGTVID